jgi:hypothetical protein
VTVSVKVRATVELVEVSVFARFSVKELAVEVSIVIPEFKFERVNVFVPLPSLEVTPITDPATPWVTVTESVPELAAKKRFP